MRNKKLVRETNHDYRIRNKNLPSVEQTMREQKFVIWNKSRLHEEKNLVHITNHDYRIRNKNLLSMEQNTREQKIVIWNKSRLHEEQKFSPQNKS
jgi:predicted MPP superfamily phosphohydrolase